MFRHRARTSVDPAAGAEVEISPETSDDPVLLHWGLARARGEAWSRPPRSIWPEGTRAFGDVAVQTPLGSDGKWVIRVPADLGPGGLAYVFFFPRGSRWGKDNGRDYWVSLGRKVAPLTQDRITERIVEAELHSPSWTLMHRYRLCAELIDEGRVNPDALPLLLVWLRFSAMRQLDWQRNYNTQPRLLTEAQDRLTQSFALFWRRHPDARLWVRWLSTTVGRGGQGQRIRDEILGIMHRNHIPEHSGNFIEQWHQKLHNNATPDDVAITRAYLQFLRLDGDVKAFYRELDRHGVTRERLASYDRPITTDPEFYGDAKEALIRDFSAYLRLLESIHASADLASAFETARPRLGQELEAAAEQLLVEQSEADSHGPEVGASTGQPVRTIELGTRARRLLEAQMDQTGDDGLLRDLLYLDLALHDETRRAVERAQIDDFDLTTACRCLADVLDDVRMSYPTPELECLAHHARQLDESGPAAARERALHARAISERAARALGAMVDHWSRCLQPKAEALGNALEVPHWAVAGFSEAVVRGSSLFALARLLNLLEPLWRQQARLGAWQVICPGRALGRVERVDELLSIQDRAYDAAVVLLCRRIRGQEEIPRGVVALITLDDPDLVSHVAVRARNQHVVFVTCWDRSLFDSIEQQRGQLIEINTTSEGGLVWQAGTKEPSPPERQPEPVDVAPVRRSIPWVLTEERYSQDAVGNKSLNLAELRRRLPDLEIPPSVALPFGTCERVLEQDSNREMYERYRELSKSPERQLDALQATLGSVEAPAELARAFAEAARQAGLEGVPAWNAAFTAVKRVWASKWNERAYYARRNAGLSDEQLVMSVLVQPVVEARYAFVLHTVDPATGNPDDLYGELVWGLGETLVGNDPGVGLRFAVPRSGTPVVRGYPSKSEAVRAEGFIFRSDSNGEDLPGYSGAGLYESATARPTRREPVDYTADALLWDERYRARLLGDIAAFGRRIEQALGCPQDIEGAVGQDRIILLQARPQVGLK
jgi:alpha-glucan,water dikinase